MVQLPMYHEAPRKGPRLLLGVSSSPSSALKHHWNLPTGTVTLSERIKKSLIVIIITHGIYDTNHRKSLDDPYLVTPGVTILQIPSLCTSLSHSLQPHNICTGPEWGLSSVLSPGRDTSWVGWIQMGSDGSPSFGVPHVTTWCKQIVNNCNSNKNDH